MTWHENLIRLRGDKTVKDIADALSISPDTYMAYERGDREPKPRVKEMIAAHFGIDLSQIWPE